MPIVAYITCPLRGKPLCRVLLRVDKDSSAGKSLFGVLSVDEDYYAANPFSRVLLRVDDMVYYEEQMIFIHLK